METLLYTIRHGQTEYNVKKMYCGTTDIPLDTTGTDDTLEAGKKLKQLGITFDFVVSSVLQRAIQTAQILAKNIPIVRTPLCNERNYGKMQGLNVDQVKFIKPEIKYINVDNDRHSINPPLGESFMELRRRAELFYEFILKNYLGSRILVVSHGVFLQQFHGIILGKNWRDSLALEVPNLILKLFRIADGKIEEERTYNLCDRNQSAW